jgi:uncharacterized protein
LTERNRPEEGGDPEERKGLSHEQVGKKILQTDKGLREIIEAAKIDPDDIYKIFLRETPPKLANLISSDLEADRIDYLLRTAHHAGLPYGNIDLPYLLSQLRIDAESRICLTRKALRTAEHFLLGRYFDYSQVAYHKTVAALELVLADVLSTLVREGRIDCSARTISARIGEGTWSAMDDSAMTAHIVEMASSHTDPVLRTMARSIILREPPKLVWQQSYLASRDDGNSFRPLRKMALEKRSQWADHFGMDKRCWWIWAKSGLALTKIGSHIPVGVARGVGEKELDKYDQSIRILNPDKTSVEIMSLRHSLMSILANQALFSLRVYVLLDPEDRRRTEIEQKIANDMEG